MIKKDEQQLIQAIRDLKKEKSIYIIAHYYQREAIQDIADFVGDSYSMAVAAKQSPCNVILVAGVDFMAESAAILCPDKMVLSPEPLATCPMANSISAADVLAYKEQHPDSIIVSYVNTPAEIKAVSDICCTSSNAEKIINRFPQETNIYFIPDQNLAVNVAHKLGRKLDYFASFCPIHARVTKEDLVKQQEAEPGAMFAVHPECGPELVAMADYCGSTAGIINYVLTSPADKFIIATECGVIHAINKANADKQLFLASEDLICPNMKSITLDKILYSIEQMQTIITVPENIRVRAAMALEKMIAYGS